MTAAHSPDELACAVSSANWRERLRSDARLVESLLPLDLADLHEVVTHRARSTGRGLILSGSTARGRRTEISDLDYHFVGPMFASKDLSWQLDMHVLSEEQMRSDIVAGDDFIQWSLRFGLIVFDDGVLLSALRLVADHHPWPSVGRKIAHAKQSVDLARRFVATGDEDGALVQVRTALSLAARAHLLGVGVFPLSRAELPAQLRAVGAVAPADALEAAIHEAPSLHDQYEAVRQAEALVAAVPAYM